MKIILKSSERSQQPLPVEGRAGITLATGGDIAMADDGVGAQQRIGRQQRPGHRDQPLILGLTVGEVIGALQLDPDGEIVAGGSPPKAGAARMPGPPIEGDELGQAPITLDQQVGGDLQPLNRGEKGVAPGLQPVGEQLRDMAATKLARGQADVVDHQQGDLSPGAIVAVGRR